jgi:putative membrane protein
MSSIVIESLVRSVHFTGIAALIATLAIQNVLMRPSLNREELQRLVRVDALYGLSALVTLSAGLTLWLWVGKSSAFYSQNPLFLAKIGLFAVIGVLSLWPTRFLLRARKPNSENTHIPNSVRLIKRVELLMFWSLPFLATAMARGLGLS